jgi:hypothetical protein
MHRLTLQIRPDQYKALKALSQPGLSLSALTRKALDDFLERELAKAPR